MAALTIQVKANPYKATKRPRSVVSKVLSTPAGAKIRVTSLDANGATLGAAFRYVFKNNMRRARKGNRSAP